MERIYRQYGGMVLAYLTRLCQNRELAQELTQETFYQAVRHINRFEGKSSVYTWLCGIAKHLYCDALRASRPAQPLEDALPAPEDFTEQLCRKDQAMAAHRLLHVLDEPYREVFTLRTFCDLSHAQIADLFGKSEAWSRVAYYRARQMLRSAMEEKENEEK
ncbi:MAG: sigma-70 family RNA polymerase sigma factor [Clostridia bacterium]|nr:sigma-70 family RNA polymerase sigma factor [Clostridia bacterium]